VEIHHWVVRDSVEYSGNCLSCKCKYSLRTETASPTARKRQAAHSMIGSETVSHPRERTALRRQRWHIEGRRSSRQPRGRSSVSGGMPAV
jgi:hypothetical protein